MLCGQQELQSLLSQLLGFFEFNILSPKNYITHAHSVIQSVQTNTCTHCAHRVHLRIHSLFSVLSVGETDTYLPISRESLAFCLLFALLSKETRFLAWCCCCVVVVVFVALFVCCNFCYDAISIIIITFHYDFNVNFVRFVSCIEWMSCALCE